MIDDYQRQVLGLSNLWKYTAFSWQSFCPQVLHVSFWVAEQKADLNAAFLCFSICEISVSPLKDCSIQTWASQEQILFKNGGKI